MADKIEQIFELETFTDTRKVSNRSNSMVPDEILNKIESGITIEELNSIDLPVFLYKTQITIHGQFSPLQNNYLCGYKFLFQNQNKSIGIKWNAIDINKKSLVTECLRLTDSGFSSHLTSSDYTISKLINANNIKTIEDLESFKPTIEKYRKLALELKPLFFGYVNAYILSGYTGKYLCVDIKLNAIKIENLWLFIEKLTGIKNESEYLDVKTAAKIKSDKEHEALQKKWEEENETKQLKFKTQKEEFLSNNQIKYIHTLAEGRYLYIEPSYDGDLVLKVRHIWNRNKSAIMTYTQEIRDIKDIPPTDKTNYNRKQVKEFQLKRINERLQKDFYFKFI